MWLTGTCPAPVAPARAAKRVRLFLTLMFFFVSRCYCFLPELGGVVCVPGFGLGVPILSWSFSFIFFGEASYMAPS